MARSCLLYTSAALLIFALIVFVCDLVPKLLALADCYRFARLGVRVMQVVMPIVDPIARTLQRISERLADAITPSSIQPIPFLSEDELETLVELSAEEGTLHVSESEMIQEIIKLGDKTAKVSGRVPGEKERPCELEEDEPGKRAEEVGNPLALGHDEIAIPDRQCLFAAARGTPGQLAE